METAKTYLANLATDRINRLIFAGNLNVIRFTALIRRTPVMPSPSYIQIRESLGHALIN